MSEILLFNKPYRVLCQFRASGERATLAEYIERPGFYPAGRLDHDSEGLVVLTDDGALQHRISHPDHKLEKTYWVQVEGDIDEEALQQLRKGVQLKDGPTLPATVKVMEEPSVWPRHPPVRYRREIPTRWLEIRLREGRNRQVRRMTAAVGHPTLRLIRAAIGNWRLEELQPGEYRQVTVHSPVPAGPERRHSRRGIRNRRGR